MKLDINRAWTDALNLIQTNSGVVAIVAGVFFFLPYFALVLLMPDMAQSMAFEPNSDDPSVVMDQVMALYADVWWAMVLMIVAQVVGTIALLALLRAHDRPTVGEAIKIGAIGFLTYIVVMLLVYIGMGIAGGLVMGIAIASDVTALAVILGIVLVVALIYIAVKLSLVAPVIGIDKVYNPFTAIVRSWRLTKGNSLRLFAFFVLLVIALLVVSLVLGLIVALVFGLAGPEVAAIGAGLFNAILNAVYVVIMLGVLAAVHRQLAGPDTEAVTETFE